MLSLSQLRAVEEEAKQEAIEDEFDAKPDDDEPMSSVGSAADFGPRRDGSRDGDNEETTEDNDDSGN